jgi:hypothetical protein
MLKGCEDCGGPSVYKSVESIKRFGIYKKKKAEEDGNDMLEI